MSELPNNESDARVHLYGAMNRATDPRWSLLPVEPLPDPLRRSRFWGWISAAIVAVGLIAIARALGG